MICILRSPPFKPSKFPIAFRIQHLISLFSGTTIQSIAWHKAGIFKPSAVCFTVPQPQEAMEVLAQVLQEAFIDAIHNRCFHFNTCDIFTKLFT